MSKHIFARFTFVLQKQPLELLLITCSRKLQWRRNMYFDRRKILSNYAEYMKLQRMCATDDLSRHCTIQDWHPNNPEYNPSEHEMCEHFVFGVNGPEVFSTRFTYWPKNPERPFQFFESVIIYFKNLTRRRNLNMENFNN